MASITLSNILNGEVNRLVGVSYEQNPCNIVLMIDEVDNWIEDQEQILGIKWIKKGYQDENASECRVERYYCHRSGGKRPYTSTVSESKQRLNQKPSIKIGCNAHFWVRQRLGSDEVDIEYHWQHQNHSPSTVDHFDHSRFPKKISIKFNIFIYYVKSSN